MAAPYKRIDYNGNECQVEYADMQGSQNVQGTSEISAKLGTSNVGDTQHPIYLEAGVPKQCTRLGSTTYGMQFNATTFQTDPTSCLTYTEDCTGFVPVDGSSSTSLVSHQAGSWDLTSNPILSKCFYATFDSSGNLHEKLNPDNLAQYVATWDSSTSSWISGTGSSHITTENTMFCIPTLYIRRHPGGLTLSMDPTKGEPLAHTGDGQVYDYLAIGVYEGYDDGSKLMSLSNKVPARDKTIAQFRTHVQANGGTGWMLTNWHQRTLIRDLSMFISKSFDSQRKFGQGFTTGGSSSSPEGKTTGLLNAYGPFAGNATGTTDSVKCLIENPWGSKWEFVDDIATFDDDSDGSYTDIYAGQNIQPSYTKSAMKRIGALGQLSNGWCIDIQTSNSEIWGLWNTSGGGDSVGLCDYHWQNSGIQTLCIAGGASDNGSGCGSSYWILNCALSESAWNVGARPAKLFNI